MRRPPSTNQTETKDGRQGQESMTDTQTKSGQHPFKILSARKSGRQDSNLRPPGPKPGALPGCATPRCKTSGTTAENARLSVVCGCKGIYIPHDGQSFYIVFWAFSLNFNFSRKKSSSSCHALIVFAIFAAEFITLINFSIIF